MAFAEHIIDVVNRATFRKDVLADIEDLIT